jgi:hypothetical protein
VLRVSKFADGFNVVISGAPGAGNTVSYDWLLYRH